MAYYHIPHWNAWSMQLFASQIGLWNLDTSIARRLANTPSWLYYL
jgi:hypothetical protein